MKKLGSMSDDELKDKLKNNYGIEVFRTDLLIETSLLNWRVIFELKDTTFLSSCLFKTRKEGGWIEEFYIYATPIYNKIIMLVDSNCPEYLFIDPSDLIDPIKDYLINTNINLFDSLNNCITTNISTDYYDGSNMISTTASPMFLNSPKNLNITTSI